MISRLGLRGSVVLLVLSSGFLWLLYWSGFISLWQESEEYGHGWLVLLLLSYLLYLRRDQLRIAEPKLLWCGPLLALGALAFAALGAISGISQLEMYALWLMGVALTFALGGVELFRKLLMPLLIAFMIIPLPQALEPALTAELQLISSKLGAWFIRLFGGVVYLEGNVIDMGGVTLLVADACAGLRYLYPLMSLGAIGGYLFQGPLWMRWTIFLSTVPITIFMNSFRIGATGLLAENFGIQHTEGFLHFFEGWVVFICALLTLALVAWLLTRLLPNRPRLIDTFSLEPRTQARAEGRLQLGSGAVIAVAMALIGASVLAPMFAQRADIHPERRSLAEFPVILGDWSAREYRLPSIVEAVAGASEYYYGDFFSPEGDSVNLYVSYYETQRNGQIPHSPDVCIPGDGWVIESHQPVNLQTGSGAAFAANRLLTSKGDKRVLAYYWLKQGSRTYRQQLLARMDLIRSAAFERRTDGALIRLVAELKPGESEADVDRRLARFSERLTDVLPVFVPD